MEQFKSDLVQCYTRAGSKVSTCVTVLKKSIGGHTKMKIKSVQKKGMKEWSHFSSMLKVE